MFRPANEGAPLTPGERNFVMVFLALLLGFFAAEVVRDYQPGKLAALFFVLFWVPLLAIHEAGHAVVAALSGWYVGRVVIGMGRLVAKFRVGHAVVEIRLFPIEGFVQPVPRNLRHVRLKSALIYFAGVGAELLALAVLVLLLGPSTLLTRSDHLGILAAQMFAAVVLFTAFVNLVPHAVDLPGGQRIANDGLGIIRSFTLPESYFAEHIGSTYDDERGEWQEYDPADWWKRNEDR